jgi:hypothetical protein
MSASLAEALDASIDDILERGISLRECLQAWPEYQAELAWLLPVVAQLSSTLLPTRNELVAGAVAVQA